MLFWDSAASLFSERWMGQRSMDQITTLLWLVAAFQIQHLVADFFLQNTKMIMGRERYWHMGRAQHAGIHAVFSLVVLAMFGAPWVVIFWMVLAEFVVHFHIDWGQGALFC